MRIAFFGTPAFAVPTLRGLLASPHEVVLVVTQPDRARGRGQRISLAPVKALAVERGIPVLQPDRLTRDPWERTIGEYGAELGVVAAYGKILPDWLLAQPARGLINVHASLLPRYRGASPVHRAVLHGDDTTGVTIMRVVTALDAGPILASVRVAIGPDDRTDQVESRLAEAGARLLIATVDRLAAGAVVETSQDDAHVTYAPRLTKDEGLVDWQRPASAIHNQVRGLVPWPRAYTFGPHGRLILHLTRVEADGEGPASDAPTLPGTVLAPVGPESIRVSTGSGVLLLLELQAEGGKVLPARAFLAGHPLVAGDRLSAA